MLTARNNSYFYPARGRSKGYRRCNIDPKRDELALARVNPREIEGEARTGELFNTLG